MSEFARTLQHGIIQRLRDRLASLAVVEAPIRAESKLAAVAVLVRVADPPEQPGGDAELLFIKRAILARDPWSGHIAFPGGRYEAGDASLVQTAVRETREELAIDLVQSGLLIGQLDDIAPRSPSLPPIIVRPFVAVVSSDISMQPNSEVADAFWVRVSQLRAVASRTEHLLLVNGEEVRFPAYGVRVHGMRTSAVDASGVGAPDGGDTRPEVVWGLTERIVSQLLPLFDLDEPTSESMTGRGLPRN